MDKLIFCITEPQLRGLGTDHLPILTKLELLVDRVKSPPMRSFCDVDWESFCKVLETNLLDILGPDPIGSEEGLNMAVVDLTQAIQDAIGTTIPFTCPSPHCKRWWTHDLDVAKRSKNRLSQLSYRYRALPDHPVHEEHRAMQHAYGEAIHKAKREHWTAFIEDLSYSDIWIANCYMSSDVGDGGKTRIPTLSLGPNTPGGSTRIASSNKEKSVMLASIMFPRKPDDFQLPEEADYDDPLAEPCEINEEQLWWHLARLSPYKVLGADGIPNVILKKGADYIIPYLLQIYRAALSLGLYLTSWS